MRPCNFVGWERNWGEKNYMLSWGWHISGSSDKLFWNHCYLWKSWKGKLSLMTCTWTKFIVIYSGTFILGIHSSFFIFKLRRCDWLLKNGIQHEMIYKPLVTKCRCSGILLWEVLFVRQILQQRKREKYGMWWVLW